MRRSRLLLTQFVVVLFSADITSSAVVFNALFLTDSSDFQSQAFSSLVVSLTNATGFSVLSRTPLTITGAEGKRIFANSSTFYNFQLLHVNRLRVSIQVKDEMTATAIIRFSLAREVERRGLGSMGIDSVESEPELKQSWFTVTYIDLPGYIAQYLILGWGLTVLAFGLCALMCSSQAYSVVPVAVLPGPQVAVQTIPDPASLRMEPF